MSPVHPPSEPAPSASAAPASAAPGSAAPGSAAEALFTRNDDTFTPSRYTVGPWSEAAQHGGPPSSLLAGVMETCDPVPGMVIRRLAVEFLSPVPVKPLRAKAWVARPGRQVSLVSAELFDEKRVYLRAHGWRLLRNELGLAVSQPAEIPAVPEQEQATGSLAGFGFADAVEWRMTRGGFGLPGTASGWCRLRMPIVAGMSPTPLQRVVVAADSGNGISGELAMGAYLYPNVDLTLHLHALPDGEWVGLDSETSIGTDGAGLAHTRLYDEHQPLGYSHQTLLVSRAG